MIVDILEKNYSFLQLQLLVLVISDVLVILSIGIDLYFGIKKSKSMGIYKTHSYGLRKTSEKVVQYLAFMVFMHFIDVLNPIWAYFDLKSMPLLTLFGAIVLIYTEWKSVKEKADEKFRYAIKNNPNDIINWVKENRELISVIKERIDNEKPKNHE